MAESVDYQQRATEFKVGDRVYSVVNGTSDNSGRVTAVWPAIGMVDVEYPHGSTRSPVEELHLLGDNGPEPPKHSTTPGGAGSVSVSGGPKAANKLARQWVERQLKTALYWGAKDRKYRATRGECDSGSYHCPKCKEGVLRKAIYKRTQGVSERLLGCPSCMFLAKTSDIIGHPSYQAEVM